MRIGLRVIRNKALVRPPGYFEHLCAAGEVIGDYLFIPEETFDALSAQLRAKFSHLDGPLNLAADLSNYDAATAPWRDAGIAVVDLAVFLARRRACQGSALSALPCCDYFLMPPSIPAGRCELLCTALQLPCSPLPLTLAAAACPLPPPTQRWPSHPATPLQPPATTPLQPPPH